MNSMAALFSKTCEYGLQAMLYLAAKTTDGPMLQRDISDGLDIPSDFLGKVLQSLSRNGLVSSQKGRHGGFRLAKPAQDISPLEIINAIDGPTVLHECVMGFPGCHDDSPCPVHQQWGGIRQEITEMLQTQSLQQLSQDLDIKFTLLDELGRTNQ